jgi:hypothetical protein
LVRRSKGPSFRDAQVAAGAQPADQFVGILQLLQGVHILPVASILLRSSQCTLQGLDLHTTGDSVSQACIIARGQSFDPLMQGCPLRNGEFKTLQSGGKAQQNQVVVSDAVAINVLYLTSSASASCSPSTR